MTLGVRFSNSEGYCVLFASNYTAQSSYKIFLVSEAMEFECSHMITPLHSSPVINPDAGIIHFRTYIVHYTNPRSAPIK